jgi:thiol-disulfide isomerase/thioredoxin
MHPKLIVAVALLASSLAWCSTAPAAELLEFSAPWCAPCRDYVPTIEQLKAEGYPVRCVNFDTDKAAVQKYGVRDIPEVILLDDSGQPVRRVTGVQPIGTLRQWFAELPRSSQQAQGSNSGQTPHPSIVRVEAPGSTNPQGGQSVSFGSGVLVSPDIVVTNWHVVNELVGAPIVHFPGQPAITGQVVKTDQTWDLAAIRVHQSGALPVHIASKNASRGQPLTIIGYGSGQYRAVAGYCGRYHAPRVGMPFEFVQVTTAARNGDSGGPVLNAQGDLAGVLNSADSEMTLGPCATRVRWFLYGAGQGPGQCNPNPATPNTGGQPVIPSPDTSGPLVPVAPAPSAPVIAPVPPIASVPKDILDRIVALEQKVAGTPGLLAGLQTDFQSQLAAIKGNLTDPGKLAALEATVQSVASDIAALQNAPGLLGEISTSVQAWIPTLAGGGLAGMGLGIPAFLGAMGLNRLWEKVTGTASSSAAAGVTPNAAAVPGAAAPAATLPAALPNLGLTLPNIGAQLAQFNAALGGLTTAANQAMANQAAVAQAAANQAASAQTAATAAAIAAAAVTPAAAAAPVVPPVLPQVTNTVPQYVQVQVPTARQKGLEQALTSVATDFPGSAGLLAQIQSRAAQFESGLAQL